MFVGDQAVCFFVGQVQCVVVVCVLLNFCLLLLLDEFAVSFDVYSEQCVMEVLNVVFLCQIMLMVIYQLEDFVDWDVIWVMQDGWIIE